MARPWPFVVMCMLPALGAAAQEPLVAESFDVGQTEGSAPVGFHVEQPAGAGVRVSDEHFAAVSPPFSLALSDDAPVGRPEAHHALAREVAAGSLRVKVHVALAAEAPAGVQLRSRTGGFLGAVLLSSNGRVGHDNGSGTVHSAVSWTPGEWSEVRVDWFADGSFDAYLGVQRVASRVPFAGAGVPGRVVLTSGFGSGTGQRCHFDDLVATELCSAADFDAELVGAAPSGFWVDAPPGTSVQVAVADTSHKLRLADLSSSARPTAVKAFAATPEGSVSLDVRVPAHAAAPFDVQLRSADHAFLAAIRLGADGKLAFHNGALGNGPFTSTALAWQSGVPHTLHLEWTGQDRFRAFLDGARFVNDAPLAAQGDPAELVLVAGTRESVGQEALVDEVVVRTDAVESVRGRYQDNALWLAHCYANSQRCIDMLPDLLSRFDQHYGVSTLFLNVGMLDAHGTLAQAGSGLSRLPAFLEAVRNHELASGRRFHVVAWINGLLSPAGTLSLASQPARANIAAESARFVSALVGGSYVSGSSRTFDGVQLDLEPTGPTPARDPHFVGLLQQIRSAFQGAGASESDLGIAAHALGQHLWRWEPEDFYQLAPLVDHLAIMTYSVDSEDGHAYRSWIEAQTRSILQAISGRSFADAAHPSHGAVPRVFMGLPAMASTAHHDADAENVRWGAPGIDRAISAMIRAGDPSVAAFAGTALYLHLDGSAASGYADWTTDYWWVGRHWLGAW